MIRRFAATRLAATRFALAMATLAATPSFAAQCGGDFNAFLSEFSREAAAQKISQQTIQGAFAELSPDPRVIQLDGRQGVFKRSFEEFGPPRVNARIARARSLMSKHAALLDRIEQQFGVPGAVVVSIWGLETDFGVGMGKHPVVRAVATLAHDCRRSEMFQRELMAALSIINQGDMSNAQLLGAWAGEIGQTQFLPSSYVKFAVDFDGNGRRDLIRSVPDALASTANYLRGHGWQRGGALAEGTHNFSVLKEWNRAQVYQKTIALFTQRLQQEEGESSRFPGAAQHVAKRNDALQTRDRFTFRTERSSLGRSRICGASLRAAPRPGHATLFPRHDPCLRSISARMRSSCARSSGVNSAPKSSASKTGRISISDSSPGMGSGQRRTHSTASSIDLTCHIQKPATSSLVSANGPSMVVFLPPENRTRLPSLLGWSPSPASMMPAFTSSSLNLPMSASSFSLGITPASEFFVALTITMTRIVVLLLGLGERSGRG
jgi:membrane-bound lytic murein transglycosylase B